MCRIQVVNVLSLVSCFGIAFATASPAVSATLYAGNESGTFFTIDTDTSNTSTIANVGVPIEALAYDEVTDTLFGGNVAGQLFTIDRSNGAVSMINGSTGYEIHSLEFDLGDGNLYGGDDGGGFFRIDPVDGTKTALIIYDKPVNSLGYVSADGRIYAGTRQVLGASTISRINALDLGRAYFSGDLGVNVMGLAYDPVDDVLYGGGNLGAPFFTIDRVTADVGALPYAGPGIRSLAYVPEPSTLVLSLLGLIAVVVYRLRQ